MSPDTRAYGTRARCAQKTTLKARPDGPPWVQALVRLVARQSADILVCASRSRTPEGCMKKELRTKLRQTMAALGPHTIHERSGRAALLLFDQPEYKQAEIMMTYLSMPLEADTTAVVLRAWHDRKRVLA